MSPSTPPPAGTGSDDEDLAGQAHPGHGVPSQDTDAAAQFLLDPQEIEREAHSVLIAGGMGAGLATGTAIGITVAGPVGGVVGATLGAIAGALGGAAAGVMEHAASDAGAAANSGHLHIDDSGGSGRPVVLIHGWPLSAQAWEPQLSALQAAGYRVVAYDRRGFGRSDKPDADYSYDALADDLERVMEQCELQDATLVGFSMGGGEVARYIARYGESRLHSVVFAAAVPPYLLKTADNPDGPLTPEQAQRNMQALKRDRSAFFEQFTRDFFCAHGVLQVSESQRRDAIVLCHQSAPHAALACMNAFSTTDFREDLKAVTVPTLVLHGDADAIVPIEGSGERTHRAIPHSQLVRVAGAPHGLNVSHQQAFNAALLSFLQSVVRT